MYYTGERVASQISSFKDDDDVKVFMDIYSGHILITVMPFVSAAFEVKPSSAQSSQ